jgi:hypothetical protein
MAVASGRQRRGGHAHYEGAIDSWRRSSRLRKAESGDASDDFIRADFTSSLFTTKKHTDKEEDEDSTSSVRVLPFTHGLGTVLASKARRVARHLQTYAFDFTAYRALLSLDTNCCAVPNAY